MRKLLALCLLISGLAVAQTRTFPAQETNNTFTGTNTFNGTVTIGAQINLNSTGNSNGNFVNTGIFTNTQMNQYVTSNINSLNFVTEWQVAQGATFATEGLSGGVATPNTSTVHQTSGVAGYANNSSTSTNAVGGYFQARCLVSGASCWGLNSLVSDTAAGAATIYGNETDAIVNKTTTTAYGIHINASFNAQPTNSFGVNIAKPQGGTWTVGLQFPQGSTLAPTPNNAGISFNPIASGVNQESQGIEWIAADPTSGFNFIGQNEDAAGAMQWKFTHAGAIFPAWGLQVTGATTARGTLSHAITANRTWTFPDANITKVADTATLTLKKGSGAGNYTNATTSYTVADSTNLCLTVTIPSGWKLGINASGGLSTATAAVVAQAALTDNAACSTANAGILVETPPIQGAAISVADTFALNWVITGDGAAHNVALQFKTSNAADTASLINSSATVTPTMVFNLMPSN